MSLAQHSEDIGDEEDTHVCRHCHLPISEGHAYELGGDRWHMYCFSCSKCSKLLGTSSNFMVLGTGDLICSDCSYSCNSCGKKIDDLAILTGDQAYCSKCFCCRNCHKKIEDLRYARTSKGLFCMNCHEKLLAKKKKHDLQKKLKESEKILPKLPTSKILVPDRIQSPDSLYELPISLNTATSAHSSLTNLSKLTKIPPRSPNRALISSTPPPPILEPPVSINSNKEESDYDDIDSSYFYNSNLSTPVKNQILSPLRSNVNKTPNGDINRKAVVVDSISSSSSTNILASYIKEPSPQPPLLNPPKLPNFINNDEINENSIADDFIDMNDTSENEEEEEEEDDDDADSIRPQELLKDDFVMNQNYTDSTTPLVNQNNNTSPFKSSNISPMSRKSDSLLRSKSIKSPKNFFTSFASKHKKSESSSSMDYKISSPFLTSDNVYQNSRDSPRLSTGAASFQTPPLTDGHQRHYSNSSLLHHKKSVSSGTNHIRSRSDINNYDSLIQNNNNSNVSALDEKRSLELELRLLKVEIMEMKQTKGLLLKDIHELSFKRDNLNQQVLSLNDQINELKPTPPTPQLVNTKSDKSIELPQISNSLNQQTQQLSLDDKKSSSSRKFWKRNIFKSDNMSSSQSNYSINNLLNDNNNEDIKNLISEPFLKTDEIDELGGNDNKKFINNKYIDLQSSNSKTSSETTSNISNFLIMSDLFNSTLESRAQFEKRKIPLIITRLVDEVEKRGLDLEGIYRKNGGTSQMNSILNSFNNLYQAETSFELEKNLEGDINALTSSLKKYLYSILPEPIIPLNQYDEFIKIDKFTNPNDKIKLFKSIFLNLPITNFKTLEFLLKHFNKVEKHNNLNKMNYYNLSVVFAPTFTRVNSSERELMDMKSRNNVMEFLLRNSSEILKGVDR